MTPENITIVGEFYIFFYDLKIVSALFRTPCAEKNENIHYVVCWY